MLNGFTNPRDLSPLGPYLIEKVLTSSLTKGIITQLGLHRPGALDDLFHTAWLHLWALTMKSVPSRVPKHDSLLKGSLRPM